MQPDNAMLNQYRIVLKRDADFWRDELVFTDKQTGAAIPLLSAELIIHPSDGSGDISWNETNGKLLLPTDGVIQFSVGLEEIEAYTWKEATYCLSITFTNNMRDRSFLTGPVEVLDEC